MTTTTQPAIEVVHVSKSYGSVSAVADVSLSIRQGEFFSFLGPSGCGKTTLLRMIAGFVTPTSGDVRIRGQVVNDVPAYRRETNMVFQQLALFPHLNVFDNVAFSLTLKHRPRAEIGERVRRALDQVSLQGYESRRTHELSGGQQQRVAIARALVNEPAALLLDEPLGALDLKLRNLMQLELKAIQRRLGTTFLYVTHDQTEAMTMSDRIAVMREGRVEQVGNPVDIYRRPANSFVANFVGETNILIGRVIVAGLRSTADCHGVPIDIPPGPQSGQTVTYSLRPEDVIVGRANPDGPPLHSAIVEAVAFLGSNVRYQLRLASDWMILAQTQLSGERMFGQGEMVHVGWSVANLVPLDH